MSKHSRRLKLNRFRGMVLPAALLLMLFNVAPLNAQQGTAAGEGSGAITTGYSQEAIVSSSSGLPLPQPGTCGGKITSIKYFLNQAGTYSAARSEPAGAAAYAGPSTATIRSNTNHYFNQEGTYSDPNCTTPATIPADFSVSGSTAGQTVSCSGTGFYSRRAVSTVVAVMNDGTCTVSPAVPGGGGITFPAVHTWEFESVACLDPLTTLSECRMSQPGDPGDPMPETVEVGGTYEAATRT